MNSCPQSNTRSAHTLDSVDSFFPRLIEEISNKIQRGRTFDLSEYVAQYPQYSDVLQQLIPSIQMLTEFGDPESQSAEVIGGRPLGDFRVMREIGRGGMGVVYEAEQLSLRRRVALKVLPFAAMLHPNHLQRFHNEAQAAAHLHHPHIVPVYAVGADRGIHFYAMQLIEGRSVADIIAELARLDGDSMKTEKSVVASKGEGEIRISSDTQPIAQWSTQPMTRPAERIRCMVRFAIQAAGAVHFAHEQGIVHRDIKPANLLIDNSSSLWITDFGLALTSNDCSLTTSQDLLGTLRYMSPEQASETLLVDHRTDIYSLGVTLYEMLTLRPAVLGTTRQSLLKAVIESQPIAPSTLNQHIPTDLETIVLKAMSKDRQDRYQSAADMADDLQRYLDHKPIQAKRPTWVQRTSKWVTRHRRVAASAAAVLLIALIGLTGGTVSLVRAYHAESKQRERAEASLDLAVQAIDQVYGEFVGKDLGDTTELSPTQARLLQIAQTTYEKLAVLNDEESSSWSGHLAIPLRLAGIYQRLGQFDKAEQTLRRGIPLLQRAVQNADGDTRVARQGQLAILEEALADTLVRLGQATDAERFYSQAIQRIEQLPANDRTRLAIQYNLQGMRSSYAKLLLDQRRFDEADTTLAAAEQLCRDLLSATPKAEHHNQLGNVLFLHAKSNHAQQRVEQALGLLRLAIEHNEKAVELDPTERRYPVALLANYEFMAVLAIETGFRLAEIQAYESCVDQAQRLCELYPGESSYRADLGDCHAKLAMALATADRKEESAVQFKQAAQVLDEASADGNPAHPAEQTRFGKARYNLGTFLFKLGDMPQAQQHLALAVNHLTAGLADQPDDVMAREYIAKARDNLGMTHMQSDNTEAGMFFWKANIADWRALVAAHPANAEYISRLGATLSNIAAEQLRQGQPQAAKALLEEAIVCQTQALELNPHQKHAAEFLNIHRQLLKKTESASK